ncbi:MAG: DUF4040 domain-containing protein [Azospirillum sp.]|nr:DUF4040 domain-containing protein [Azospirillum sp.]
MASKTAPIGRAGPNSRFAIFRCVAGYLLAAALPAALTGLFVSLVPEVAGGGVLRWSVDWVPSLGVRLSFLVDGLGLVFALLISGIGVVVFVYARAYLDGHPQLVRFFVVLTLFMLAMLGTVLADNLIALFVFWELTTLTSYLLIGFTHERADARAAALQALLVTGIGGLAMLAGFILLGAAAGTFELSQLRAGTVDVRADPRYLPLLGLILVGCFTKSAQFPFHFWLPNAMAAPTPVSAYLHSATMVKAGIYLMARLLPTLGGTEAWTVTLTAAGAVTAVLGSVWALGQSDLKQLLAYTTVMGLGTLTLLLGLGGTAGVVAAMVFLLVHCFYKAALFLVVGAIDHATHTRERDALSGLAAAMPVTFVTAALAALSMAGLPPLVGFIAKELIYVGAVEAPVVPAVVVGAALAANALTVTAAGLVALGPFLGVRRAWSQPPHDPPWTMWSGPLLLAALGVGAGLYPALIDQTLVAPAASAVLNTPVEVHLALWHGLGLPLALSGATLALGLAAWSARRPLDRALAAAAAGLPRSAEGVYDAALAGMKGLAAWQTAVLQHGRLRGYLATVFATMIALIGLAFLWGGLSPAVPLPLDVPLYAWGAAALILAGTAVTLKTTSRLTAICALGAVGIGVAILFVSHGAVDVALTQLLCDILFVILLAVALLKLPRFRELPHRGRAAMVATAGLAVAFGTLVSLILLEILATPLDLRLTEFFQSHSQPTAHGRNIVNVILVDFRAFDTLGEIAVVMLAGLAAVALIRVRASARRHQENNR